jgi:ABC-type glycerol-3-phosphate transport system substrate-binding protein
MFSMRGGTQQGDVDWNFDWGMAQLPQDVAPFTAAFYEGYVINAQTDNPQESWEWLDFLSEQVNPRMIPARLSLAESREFEDAVGVEAAEVARASAEDMLVINAEIWQPINLVAAVFIEAVEKIVNEGADPQQALQQAQSAAESQP